MVDAFIKNFPTVAGPQTIEITGFADSFTSEKGSSLSFNTFSSELSIYNKASLGYDHRRAAMEFDLSQIPAGATIVSAKLKVRVSGTSYDTNLDNYSQVNLYGYQGDGIAQQSDSFTSGLSIGQSDYVYALGFYSLNLNKDIVDGLSGQIMGIAIRNELNTLSMNIRSSDDSNSGKRPRLVITYYL